MHNIAIVNSGNVKLAALTSDVPYLDSLFAAVVVGTLGGLLGAIFIIINNRINILRKKYLTTKFLKVAETCVLVTLTVSVFFASAAFKN